MPPQGPHPQPPSVPSLCHSPSPQHHPMSCHLYQVRVLCRPRPSHYSVSSFPVWSRGHRWSPDLHVDPGPLLMSSFLLRPCLTLAPAFLTGPPFSSRTCPLLHCITISTFKHANLSPTVAALPWTNSSQFQFSALCDRQSSRLTCSASHLILYKKVCNI